MKRAYGEHGRPGRAGILTLAVLVGGLVLSACQSSMPTGELNGTLVRGVQPPACG